MAESMLQNVVATHPPSETGEYGYPISALVLEYKNAKNKIHLIFGSLDLNNAPGSLYDSAPNGSIYVPLTSTANDKKVWVKFGAKGLTDGAWAYTPKLT